MGDIILVDDDKSFAKSLIKEAKSHSIGVCHKRSLEGLKEIFPLREDEFVAIILDIKCLTNEDDEKEDSNFITAAITYIDQNTPRFPRFVLTGDDTEFDTISKYYSNEKVFQKTPDGIEDIFREVKFCIDNSVSLRIKREYSDIFDALKKIGATNTEEKIMINTLNVGLTEKEQAKFKGICADIRSLQEFLYKAINIKDKNIVPDSSFQSNGMIKFNKLMCHLSGHPDNNYKPTKTEYHSSAIGDTAKFIYWVCGSQIHHQVATKYNTSDSLIKSLIYSLLELVIWAESII